MIVTLGTPQYINAANLTFSVSLTGSNRWIGMLVLGGLNSLLVGPVTSLTCGGAAMTLIGSIDAANLGPNLKVLVYGKVNPASGSNSIVLTVDTTGGKFFYGWIIPLLCTEVHQTVPVAVGTNYDVFVSTSSPAFELPITVPSGGFAIDATMISPAAAASPAPANINGIGAILSSFADWNGTFLVGAQADGVKTGWGATLPGGSGRISSVNFTLKPAASANVAPNAPTIGVMVGGNAKVSAFGQPPSAPGTNPVNLYRLTLSTAATQTGTTLPIQMTATNGVAVSGTLAASNDGGSTWGPESLSSNIVTPVAPAARTGIDIGFGF